MVARFRYILWIQRLLLCQPTFLTRYYYDVIVFDIA